MVYDREMQLVDIKNHPLTMQKLTKAIQNSIEKHKIKYEDAEKMAEHFLNFFGYSDRIIDNILQTDDRDVFYIMQDIGILTTEREETTLYDGRSWRIDYWILRYDKIQELLNRDLKEKTNSEEENTVYDELPIEIWER